MSKVPLYVRWNDWGDGGRYIVSMSERPSGTTDRIDNVLLGAINNDFNLDHGKLNRLGAGRHVKTEAASTPQLLQRFADHTQKVGMASQILSASFRFSEHQYLCDCNQNKRACLTG